MLKYFNATGNDPQKAIELYKCNIQLSQAMYPLISILEVGLRNAIDSVLRSYLSSSNWILEGKRGFMVHPDMTYFDQKLRRKRADNFLVNKIIKLEERYAYDGLVLTHNKIVGDIGFGFWIKLLDAKPISILKAAQLSAFKNRSGKIQETYCKLNDIRVLRNRISHQEPICFNKQGKLCISSIKKNYAKVLEAIHWIDNDLLVWSVNFDTVQSVIDNIDKNIVKPTAISP
jgi:hypothetical protein